MNRNDVPDRLVFDENATYELRLKRMPNKERTVTHRGRRASSKPQEITLPYYEVWLNGALVGEVKQEMATREVGPATRPYVTDRWTSPAWYGNKVPGYSRLDRKTRTDAIVDCLQDVFGGGTPYYHLAALAKTVAHSSGI